MFLAIVVCVVVGVGVSLASNFDVSRIYHPAHLEYLTA